MNYAFLLSLVLVVGLTCACQADDTFAVTRTSIVSLGAEGGDTFSFERIAPAKKQKSLTPLERGRLSPSIAI